MLKTTKTKSNFAVNKKSRLRGNSPTGDSSPAAGRDFLLSEKKILDVCCGGRTFWFDKQHPNALYVDKRVFERQIIWKKGDKERYFEVKPDHLMDFRKLDLPDRSFSLVVFDPPHMLKRNGKAGWMGKKYGSLEKDWKKDLELGFAECFRVLKKDGVLIFKWSEIEILLSEVLSLTPVQPLFGHRSGKNQNTHWVAFMKI